MSKKTQEEQLPKYRQRYKNRGRKGKSRLLDEFCEQYGYNRKHAIKLLRGQIGDGSKARARKKGRPPEYGFEVVEALKEIWLASEQPCGKRLKGMIQEWLPYYPKSLSEKTRQDLGCISASQMDRLLAPFKAKHRKRLCGTKPGTLLKTQIPIKTDHWDIHQPGYMEADTVAHCGTSLEGDFIWSVVLTDIHSGWTSLRGVWNKGAHGVIEAIREMEKALPFELKGFDSDNGSEFLNHHLLKYFQERKKTPVQFTRSRPYHKNDNAHVEQKNWTHARQLLGYERLDDPNQLTLINQLYKSWELFQNFFCSNLKLKSKTRVGSKWIKRYHPPSTPYRRLLVSNHLTPTQKQNLQKLHASLNPFQLKLHIEKLLRRLHKSARRSSRLDGSLRSSPTCAISSSIPVLCAA